MRSSLLYLQNILLSYTILYILYCAPKSVEAVDRSKFRTCQDTGFCRRYRNIVQGPPYAIAYDLDVSSLQEKDGRVNAIIKSQADNTELNFQLLFYKNGILRVKINELSTNRWQPTDLLMDAGLQPASYKKLNPSIESDHQTLPQSIKKLTTSSYISYKLDEPAFSMNRKDALQGVLVVIIQVSPLKIELYRGDTLLMSANERSLMHFEQSKQQSDRNVENGQAVNTNAAKDKHGGKEIVDYGEDGLAIYADGTREVQNELDSLEEHQSGQNDALYKGDSFGGHSDSMLLGPKSVGMDFSFPYAKHVYGIPEHSSPLSLPTTIHSSSNQGITPNPVYSEPYRMYTLDVFEYDLNVPMALYGNIPLMLAHGLVYDKSQPHPMHITTGVFWFNPSETFIDISDVSNDRSDSYYKQSHWISESGEIDFFFLSGPSSADVHYQFSRLTGTQQLPPIFSLGYHQCRWNYKDEKDVANVEGNFESLDIPMDVLWLDIEHSDGKRYFTWDKATFPTPIEMQQKLANHGRRMVTIVDPHIKRDDNYRIHKEATALGLYVKNKDGNDFDGWCWPGSSSYLDFTTSKVRDWWAEQFSLDKYKGSTMDLFTWNDMNEPSVFNGPEVSMPKDAKNLQGIEHREWHNLYGIYMQMATQMGLTRRDPQKIQRPFVLTRSFWAGSQRFGAMWTGDNAAKWDHLRIASSMLLSINVAGLSFAGADAGGFFGEPGAELYTRWILAAAFTPFFRGHAHHDTKRREPWVFGDPYTGIVRDAILLRYSLLPYWYAVFYEAYVLGTPVMRPMFTEFPMDENTFSMDDQWMVGNAIMVKPVTDSGVNSIEVYFPVESSHPMESFSSWWYDLHTYKPVSLPTSNGPAQGVRMVVDAPLSKIPVFIRAGVILPRKMRVRRSSKLMFYDPYTIIIAPHPQTGKADGFVYMDDETTLLHQQNPSQYSILKDLSYSMEGTASKALLSCKTSTSPPSTPLSSSVTTTSSVTKPFVFKNTVERVVILGQAKSPSKILLWSPDGGDSSGIVERDLPFIYDAVNHCVTIKKPDVPMMNDWEIHIQF